MHAYAYALVVVVKSKLGVYYFTVQKKEREKTIQRVYRPIM